MKWKVRRFCSIIYIYFEAPDFISGFSGTWRNHTPIRFESPTPIRAPTPIRKNRDKLRFAPSLSPKWNSQFPVRRPSSFAVQAVAPDAPTPPSPASTLKYDTDDQSESDQMSFSVTRSRASSLRYDKRSFAVFPTLASTFFSVTLESASEARGKGSSVEEYLPKGADLWFCLPCTFP